MNLVLDAFERVLYPTGAAAERRRRASTGYLGGPGTIQKATGRQNGGDGYSPKQQKFSTTSSSAAAFSPHHQYTQNSSFSPPISHFPASLAIRREKAAAANRRRRSVTPNRGNAPLAGNKTIWNESNFDGQQQICHSNSLTGISGQNQLEADHIENIESTNQTVEIAMTSSQHGGITSTTRSRSSATGGGIGRRKKSVMNVGRKQSVASFLFTALSSPTIDPNRLRRRQSRAAAFASANQHRCNSPPPRQWSVPEKSNSTGEEGDEEEAQEGEEEEEHFRFIQKARSISISTSTGGRSPVRQLSSEDPTTIGPAVPMPISSPHPQQYCSSSTSIGSPIIPNSPFACCPSCSSTNSGSSSILLGFFPPPPSLPAGSFRPLNGRRVSETACLADWIRLRAEAANSLSQALLLRCVDPEPAIPFLQLANFADHEQTIRLAEELAQNGHAQFGCFEELFALERAKSTSSTMAGSHGGFHGSQGTIVDEDAQQRHYLSQQQMQSSSSGCISPSTDGQLFGIKNSSIGNRQQQHRGFILVCFRLLDEEGEGSPPCGSTLAKSAELESSWLSWTGAAQIYKYSPRAWCLRRLSLLRRVHPGFPTSAPFVYVLCCEFDAILHPTNALAALDMCERLRARNCGLVALYQVRQCFASSNSSCSSINPPQHHSSAQSLASNSLSPHWSPHQLRRQQLARMGRSQDERGRQGGGALLRMIHGRDGSLGWDVVQPTTHQTPIQTQPTTIQPPPQIGQKHWRGEPNIGTSL